MSTSRMIAFSVWMIGSIFYAYQYILRVMPNIMLGDITQQFDIDTAVFGQFSGIYYIGYSLMHMPIGIMLDRYGPRNVMTICILLTVIGMLPILFTKYWVYPLIGRLLVGIGSSAAILGTFKIIRITFSEKYFTRMLSLSVTIGLIGAIYGGAPLKIMCDTLGYKTVIKIFVLVGLILGFFTYLIVPNIKIKNTTGILLDMKIVFSNTKVIATCIFAGLMIGPMEGFADVWGSAFFTQEYGFSKSIASYLPSMIFIGMCFGAPILSIIAEKTNHYFTVIIAAGIIMLLIFSGLIFFRFGINQITVGLIIVGICSAYQILAIYKASTYVKEEVAGLTTAIANMIIMSFGYAFHTIMGIVISNYGFNLGISVIPIALLIGIIGFTSLALKTSKLQN